ncbi:MAG: hypothetical protein PHQ41_04440 [Candidatus Cloacimonetes bacterium]|nr:hypothetical protein [Candidatus Cloacimonadota bacterium]
MRNYYKAVVGTTAQRVVEQNAMRTGIGIANLSGVNAIYIGADSQVSIDNGFPVQPGTQITFNEGFGDRPDMERWIISSGGGTDVRIIEEYGGE